MAKVPKNSLMEKMMKLGTIKSEVLSESETFNNKELVKLDVPILNIALGGIQDGGLEAGTLLICGPSKHFKSNLGLVGCKAYLDKYPDAIMLFFDNEFGITHSYLESVGIDASRVLHCPFMTLEELRADLTQKIEGLTREEKVIIFIDSLGNAASKKEYLDALEDKEAGDLTRAKIGKSLWRIITPHLIAKDIPLIGIQHIYMTMEKFSKAIVSGGTGGILAASDIWILGRQQDKDASGEIAGWNFIINVEKSRRTKEKEKFSLEVSYEGGINKWSGLMDIALECGIVVKPKVGWYAKVDTSTGEVIEKNYRLAQTNNGEFWNDIIKSPKFIDYCNKKFKSASNKLISEIDQEGEQE